MTSVNNCELLENENEAEEAIILAIKNQIQLFVINKNGCLQPLTVTQLEAIRSASPRKTSIVLQSHHTGIPLDQKNVNYQDLWIEKSSKEKISKIEDIKINEELDLRKSAYFKWFEETAKKMIKEYPGWRKTCNTKVKKTAGIPEWLKKTFNVKDREAEILKKILSDFFPDL